MRLAKNVFYTIIGEALSRVPFVLSEIVIARELGPLLYGYWIMVQLIVNYNNFSHFGMLSSLAKREPILIATKQDDELRVMRGTVFLFGLIVSAIFTTGLLFSSQFFSRLFQIIADWETVFSLIVLIFCQQQFLYGTTRLRNVQKFGVLAIWRIVYSVVFLAVVIWQSQDLVLISLIQAWAAAFFISTLFFGFRFGLFPLPSWSSSVASKLFFIGFPIFLMGLTKLALVTADKIVLFRIASLEEVSYYGISLQASLLMTVLVSALGRVYMPMYLHDKAAGVSTIIEQNRMYEKIWIFFSLASYSAMVVYAMVIKIWLPQYVEGIVPGFFLIYSGLIQGMIALSIVFVVAEDKEYYAMFAFLIATVGAVIITFLVFRYTNSLIAIGGTNLLTWYLTNLFLLKIDGTSISRFGIVSAACAVTTVSTAYFVSITGYVGWVALIFTAASAAAISLYLLFRVLTGRSAT